jgi:hypothetical protein
VKTTFTAVLVAATMFSGVALAEEKASCSQYAKLAETVMELRQLGDSLQRVLALVEKGTVTETIVIDAWNYPRLTNASLQRQVIKNFSEAVYTACVRARRD